MNPDKLSVRRKLRNEFKTKEFLYKKTVVVGVHPVYKDNKYLVKIKNILNLTR